MYRMRRVFCATSWELEGERRAFYDVVGQFNEIAMADGQLYVPVSLTNIRDKRPYQYTIEENLAECRYFILALSDGWGPPERNFQRDYHLALQHLADPGSPMREVRLHLREPPSCPSDLVAGDQAPCTFADIRDFERILRSWLADWLAADRMELAGASASQ